MQLFSTRTGKPVAKGEEVTDFRGEKAIVVGWEEPRHSGSTGRIYVRPQGAKLDEGYYPSVYDCEFRK
jgi:hypothetical protein